MSSSYLSKSLVIRGLQCHKSLYLHRFHRELKDEVSPSREALFRSGSEVGLLARELFPHGSEVPYEGLSLDEQVGLTKEFVDDGTQTIYEAAFVYDGVTVKVDILHRGPEGWEIYEVKSSTSLKGVYFPDVAVQYHVVRGAGLSLSGAFLVHLNNRYVRDGNIEVSRLFAVHDVTRTVVGGQSSIEEEIEKQKEMLQGPEPSTDIGPYCRSPYVCDFMGHCWQHIPEDSVFHIKGRGPLPFQLYNQGIVRLKDVPLDCLTPAQQLQVEATLGQKIFMSVELLRDFLDSLKYPLYFLDFETFATAVPLFHGVRPYQHVPFQYSLHVLEYEGAPVKHREYMALPGTDPREGLLKTLLQEIPGHGSVLAYAARFEKTVLRTLSGWLPHYKEKIDTIISNMVDLALPFQKRYLYHWQFDGSYSLKMVLPALAPELTYEDLEIRNGEMAMGTYVAMQNLADPVESERLRKALLDYCRLDTLAMVRLLERLKDFARV